MSAELLTRAIAELDWMMTVTTPGPWAHPETTVSGFSRVVDALGVAITAEDEGGEVFAPADADLIVMLHRTIAAQRAMLLTAKIIIFMDTDDPLHRLVVADALYLARLILGEDA